MRRLFLLIDGYNLMHAAGFARRTYGPGDLHRCRHRFLLQLAALLQPAARRDCLVIFDAFNSPDEGPRQMDASGLRVEFAEPGSDADAAIEAIVKTHSAPRQVMVVSSDHRLHKAARRRRSRCVDSEVFWRQLDPDGAATFEANVTQESGRLSAPDHSQPIDSQLADEFLSLDVDQIARELREEERRRRGR